MKKRHQKETCAPNAGLVRSTALHLVLLVAIGVAAYWNSFDVPFVFDDFATIEMNSGVQFGGALLPSNVFSRALLYVTFAANHAINGEHVWGYHLVNLLLHLLNGILVYILARHIFSRTLDRKGLSDVFAIFAAMFFLLHPAQTESVTYISSRSELLATLFYILAILLFVRRPPERIGFFFSLLVGVLFVLGIGAKETVISLPAALLAYDFVFLSGGKLGGVLSRWRFYVTFLLGGLVTVWYLTNVTLRASIGGAPGNLPAYPYFLTELRVVARYVQIIFIPEGLNLGYDIRPSTSLVDLRVILSALFLLGLMASGWFWRKRQPVVAFSIFWFFITLAPTSSFVPILDVIFDHRLYLPLVGVCLSFPVLIDLAQRSLGSKSGVRLSFVQAGTVLVVLLLIGTVMRNEVWRDDARLWSDVIQKSPHKARGYMGLAQSYFQRAQYEQAIQASTEGLKNVTDNDLGFYGNIGQFYLALGRYDEALDAFFKAAPRAATVVDQGRASYNIGVTYLDKWNALRAKESQLDKAEFLKQKDTLLSLAEQAFRNSIEKDGSYLPAWDSYVNTAVDRGRQAVLRQELQQQLQKNPDKALYGLGKLAFQESDYKGAVEYFKHVTKIYASEKMFLFNYAYALEATGDLDGAVDNYVRAIHVDPLFMQAHHNLAQIYLQKGSDELAIAHFNDVLRLDPKSTLAHLQLARIYIQRGERASARIHLNAVFSLAPGNSEAAALWQQLGS